MGDARLPVLATLRQVPGVYARHWKLLVPLAGITLLPQVLADSLGEVDLDQPDTGRVLLGLGELGAATVVNMLGEALYAGVITLAVLDWRAGIGLPGPVGFVRKLPLTRLIAADLLIAFGTAIGLVMLVIPGIAFLTLTFIAPVVVKVENRGAVEAMRRSAELVRGNFWRALALVAIMTLGTEAISAGAGELVHDFLPHVTIELAVEALIEPLQGLITVLAALSLLEIHRSPELAAIESRGAGGGGAGAGAGAVGAGRGGAGGTAGAPRAGVQRP